jgi:hypothetical protein
MLLWTASVSLAMLMNEPEARGREVYERHWSLGERTGLIQ